MLIIYHIIYDFLTNNLAILLTYNKDKSMKLLYFFLIALPISSAYGQIYNLNNSPYNMQNVHTTWITVLTTCVIVPSTWITVPTTPAQQMVFMTMLAIGLVMR